MGASGKSAAWCIDSEVNTCLPEGYGRQLKAWDASADGVQVLDEVLEKSVNLKNAHWNQFETNQELFGVKSSYKEDMSQYTTPLDISAVPPDIKGKADKLAREIEKERKNSLHPEDMEVSDEDEEARWSAVPRDTRDVDSQLQACGSDAQPAHRMDASSRAEPSLPASTMRGTFVHVDGVGLLDQQTVQSMPWLLQQRSHQTPVQKTCTVDHVLGQWQGSHVHTTQIAAEVGTGVLAQPYLPSGTEVMIDGLVKSPAFNGLHGTVESFDHESGRYNVRLQSCDDEHQLAKIKIENLRWMMFGGQPVPCYQ